MATMGRLGTTITLTSGLLGSVEAAAAGRQAGIPAYAADAAGLASPEVSAAAAEFGDVPTIRDTVPLFSDAAPTVPDAPVVARPPDPSPRPALALFRPEAPALPRSRKIRPKLVLEAVRARLLEMAQEQRVFRNSPTSPLFNHFSAELIFGKRGELMTPEAAAGAPFFMRVGVTVMGGRIQLEEDTLRALDECKGTKGNDSLAQLASVIRALHGASVVAEEPEVRPERMMSTERVDVLEPVSRRQIASMKRALKRACERIDPYMMTMWFRGCLSDVLFSENLLVGTMSLDASGNVIGASLGLPDVMSPRGTRYESGMADGGRWIDIVVHGGTGTLLRADGKERLNERQARAVTGLLDATRAVHKSFQGRHPYAVDIAMPGKGNMGRLIQDLVDHCKPASTVRLALRREEGTYRLDRHLEGDPQKALAVIEATVVGHSFNLKRFEAAVMEGEVPPEVARVFAWVAKKVGKKTA